MVRKDSRRDAEVLSTGIVDPAAGDGFPLTE